MDVYDPNLEQHRSDFAGSVLTPGPGHPGHPDLALSFSSGASGSVKHLGGTIWAELWARGMDDFSIWNMTINSLGFEVYEMFRSKCWFKSWFPWSNCME